MKIISANNVKGGSGKSTLIQELAVCSSKAGAKVAIIDYDSQGSITQWGKDRENDTPVIIPAFGKQLLEFVKQAEKKEYDYLFIDTKGSDDPTGYEAMQYADLVIVPTRARKKDIFPARAIIEASGKLKKDLVFVLNHTPPKLRSDIEERAKSLSSYGTLCPVRIGIRVDYQDADDMGLSVTELNPNGKAALEVSNLWKWIVKHLNKNNPSL